MRVPHGSSMNPSFEETRHVARLRHDFDARCLKRAHLRRQIGERESDVIDAGALAAGVGLPVRKDQLGGPDLTGVGPVHRRTAHVRDVPLNGFGHVRRGKVDMVIVGRARDARKRDEDGDECSQAETAVLHDGSSGTHDSSTYNLIQSASRIPEGCSGITPLGVVPI